ncbi:MAG TPA: RQC domain-containing protein [bacterium]|nr:RQC domain-containing protein [bacterium]
MSAKIIPFPLHEEILLTDVERDAVLLAADELIAKGGKELLVQVLKGMRSELVLAAGAETLRSFGALGTLTLAQIEGRIDRMLEEDLLRVEQYWDLPLVVHSPAGWERTTRLWATRLHTTLRDRAHAGDAQGIFAEVGRVHREVKMLLLERIEGDGDPAFAPILEAWRDREGKRLKRRIEEVLSRLRCAVPSESPR